MEHCLQDAEPIGSSFSEGLSCKSLTSNVDEPEASQIGEGFECNICLDLVQDPVVTFCGHLYCWPCIYKWIISFPEYRDDGNPCCPVCKTEVSENTMIPLYGRGQTAHPSKRLIPERPSTPVSTTDGSSTFGHLAHRSYTRPGEPQSYVTLGNYTASVPVIDPIVGVFGEMVYSRIFGNSERAFYSYPNSYSYSYTATSPTQHRRMAQLNRSLGRVCFFLCCCAVMCLLLF